MINIVWDEPFEYRLIFKFMAENKVLLVDIGTHDEVY